MNQERVTLWEGHLAAHEKRLANVDTDFPSADVGLREKIRAGIMDDVKTANEFIEFHLK